jgi:fructose-bisphosphate aldolase, class I
MTATALVAADLVLAGKGILCLDEGGPAVDARLRAAGVPPGASSRRAYLEMLAGTPGLSLGISGVSVNEEAFCVDGVAEALAGRGLLAGIRADTGARPLAGAPGETVAEGLDGLAARLASHAARGARFATWRAVLRAGHGRPSWRALRANASALGRFAASCQEAGLVAVAEVVIEGAAGPEVTSAALMVTVSELTEMGVALDGVMLKTGMVSAGAVPRIVAQQTLAALWCVVPEEMAGVAFLAGGRSPARATADLAAVRRLGTPWPVTFAFGRALTGPALAAWHGDPACAAAGQRALANRVACNIAALRGCYTPVLEPGYVLAPVVP